MSLSNEFPCLLLRCMRQRGLTFVVTSSPGEIPTLHVQPKELITAFLRKAIPQCKGELIALIEGEGVGSCTGADGIIWHQTLARCPECDACDWGPREDEEGWGCRTCMPASDEAEEVLRSAFESLNDSTH